MKLLVLTITFAGLAGSAFAGSCPSPKLVLQAFSAGFQNFDARGNQLDNDPIAMIQSATAMGYMDKASVGVWRAPAGVTSDPEWKFNITLKRGIFGDGEVTFEGATVTYGGQASCRYDFAEVTGLGIGKVGIVGPTDACVPVGAKSWNIKLPGGKKPASIAARCNAGSAGSCRLACEN